MFNFINFNITRSMKRAYNGCELQSPTYRKIIAEKAKVKEDEWCHYSGMPSPKLYETEYKTKRGETQWQKIEVDQVKNHP